MNDKHASSPAHAFTLETEELSNVRGGMIQIPLTPRPPSLSEQDMPSAFWPPEVKAWQDQLLRRLRGEPAQPVYLPSRKPSWWAMVK